MIAAIPHLPIAYGTATASLTLEYAHGAYFQPAVPVARFGTAGSSCANLNLVDQMVAIVVDCGCSVAHCPSVGPCEICVRPFEDQQSAKRTMVWNVDIPFMGAWSS